MTPLVAILFARRDSIYKSLPGCDVWDVERNALKWPGGCPVVAHPPCRVWGRLRHFARPEQGEKDLAVWSVEQVRKWGGVLEHPDKSTLWQAANLPAPGQRDAHGFTLLLPQWWFGHRAEKRTLFYIVGLAPDALPEIPFRLGEPDFVIQSRKRHGHRPHVSKAERELTPLQMAKWLCEVARKCSVRESCI